MAVRQRRDRGFHGSCAGPPPPFVDDGGGGLESYRIQFSIHVYPVVLHLKHEYTPMAAASERFGARVLFHDRHDFQKAPVCQNPHSDPALNEKYKIPFMIG